jgi:acetate kinase
MRILGLNCGSSTLKFRLIELESENVSLGQEQTLAFGAVDRIGGQATLFFVAENGKSVQHSRAVNNHHEATHFVISWLASSEVVGSDGVEAVGHRVVHGGEALTKAVIIDQDVIAAIEGLSYLAPLHNRPSLEAIRAAREALSHAIPQVATFDTTFHTTLPERAFRYAIPIGLAEKHGIRRYGFHGLAHRYMADRYGAISGKPLKDVKLITLQLGNGCSATAVEHGHSVDTSMGLTPLEGLVMGTRSGDVDPTLASFLAHAEKVEVEEAEDWLNTRSGLLGVSEHSRDMGELLQAENEGNVRAALAVDMFCYRVKKYIGGYMAAMNGADAVVFGGGIGENAPQIRARICNGMDWCGLVVDQGRNSAAMGVEARISTDNSKVHAYVVTVDEAATIARDTIRCLRRQRGVSDSQPDKGGVDVRGGGHEPQ